MPGEHRTTIRAVTFDLDDTLYDLQACMARGAAQVIREICRRDTSAREIATAERFHALWHQATEDARAVEGVLDWPAVRRRGIELLLQECGCAAGAALAAELTALYFQHRRAPVDPFPDAAAALPRLAERLPLGIVTNANTRLTQIGLDAYFRVVITPEVAGCSKPEPGIFHQAAAALGCEPGELLHVGDRWEDDVVGAHRAGCQAVWYCREPGSAPDEGVPHELIRDHRELLLLFDAIHRGAGG